MRKVLFAVCMLFCGIVTSVAQDGSYRLEGRLEPTVNGQMVLIADTENGLIELGDITVTDGRFEFSGRMSEMTVVYLMTGKKDAVLATIMLENAPYLITSVSGTLVVEGGGEAQKIWSEFNDLNRYLLESQERLDAQAIANPARLQEFQREFQTILLNVEAEELALLKKYNHSIVAAWMVASKMEGVDEAKLTERYEVLGEEAQATFYGKRIVDELNKMQKIAVGAVAPDFSAPLADGGVLALHETRAKVKIVNFWASWSKPCRDENVNLLRLYKRYRPKGLEIISVSLDDNKSVWLTAIGEDGSDWKNVSDMRGPNSVIVVNYRVKTLPCIFILDDENRIVAKNLRGNDVVGSIKCCLSLGPLSSRFLGDSLSKKYCHDN